MREDRHDDLVSTTAIVAGTVVGIAATVVSLWLSAEESAPPRSLIETEGVSVVIDGTESAIDAAPLTVEEVWTDPRGPERGPTDVEWEVISAYKPIESMTSTEPGNEAVDRALVELWTFAKEHPDNPFVQEIHLKGLRVANYWAFAGGDLVRAALLHGRFEAESGRVTEHELTVREAMRMLAQRIEQSCDYAAENVRELRRLSVLFPSDHTDGALGMGVQAARACDPAATDR